MRIPPPIGLIAAAAAQRLIARRRRPAGVTKAAAVAVGAASASMLSSAALRFVAAKTSLNPHRPESASSLVIDGWHRRSRNPMYVGFIGLLLSHALARRSIAALLPAAAFAAYLDRVQIPAEETALTDRFGADYERYLATVPRWLDARSLHPAHRA